MDGPGSKSNEQRFEVIYDKLPNVKFTLSLSDHYVHLTTSEGIEYKIPIQTVLRVYVLPKTEDDTHYVVVIMLRILVWFRLLFFKMSDMMDTVNDIKSKMCKRRYEQLEVFKKVPEIYDPKDGYIYDPYAVFSRYCVSDAESAWRFCHLNQNYMFNKTYPAVFVVPKEIKDITLQFASSFRSKARIPALTYIYKPNMASLSRSSQPLVGITNKRNKQDELLVNLMFTSNLKKVKVPSNKTCGVIFDARPMINIKAQRAVGGGTESKNAYKRVNIDTLNIENIHSVHDSFSRLLDEIVDKNFENIQANNNDESGWLHKLKLILEGTMKIVRAIYENNLNILVHCSDGWDRTPQLCSLAQICLDPYFRTIDGFCTLVEKDWVSFGHQFLYRCGHLSSTDPRVKGPISNICFNSKPKDVKETIVSTNHSTSAIDDINEKMVGAIKSVIGQSNYKAAVQGIQDVKTKYFRASSNRFFYIDRTYDHSCEVSNIFPQFLECVHQLLKQYPNEFEYSANLLIELHIGVYSCAYSNFIFSCESESKKYNNIYIKKMYRPMPNIWSHIKKNRSRFTNKEYMAYKSLPSNQDQTWQDIPPLYPTTDNITHWQADYLEHRDLIDIFKVY